MEYWFKVSFESEKLPAKLMQALLKPVVADNGLRLDLPNPNELIPRNFDLTEKDSQLPDHPCLLTEWSESEVWYKQDNKFKLPKAHITAFVYTNDCQVGLTTNANVFLFLWETVLIDYLREFTYMGSCVWLEFSCTPRAQSNDGFDMQWSGYNDSLPAFVTGIMQRMKNMSQDTSLQPLFDSSKELLMQNFKNFYTKSTYKLAKS